MRDLTCGSTGGTGFTLRNGKQIARRSDGFWLFLYDNRQQITDKASIILGASKLPNPLEEEDLGEALTLVGNLGKPILEVGTGGADQGCLLIDDADVLHMVWRMCKKGEIWYAQCALRGGDWQKLLKSSEGWHHADGKVSGPQRLDEEGIGSSSLGDIVATGDGKICVSYSQGMQEERRIYVTQCEDGSWKRSRVTETGDYEDPVMDVDGDGIIHLAYGPGPGYGDKFCSLDFGRFKEDYITDPQKMAARYGIYHTQSSDGIEWTRADGTTAGSELIGMSSDHPVISTWRGKIVVAYMARGNWPGMVDRIFYSHYDGESWRMHTNLYPDNHDKVESPVVFSDRYGQPRIIYVNVDRSHIYMSRWTGVGFDKPQEIRWAMELKAAVSVEKHMSVEAEEFGLLQANGDEEIRFCRVEVPRILPQDGRKVLFLDMWEMSEIYHLDLRVNTAKKEQMNPVLPGDPQGWDSQAICYGTVLHDEGIFKMWYTARDRDTSFAGVCYAESEDGVHWEKPNLGICEYRGSKENNICITGTLPQWLHPIEGGNVTPNPSVYKDLKEPDPEQRYKMALNAQNVNTVKIFVLMMHSPDGIHWKHYDEKPDVIAPTAFMRPREVYYIMETNAFFYDEREPDEKRKWKMYGQLAGRKDRVEFRSGAFSYSEDGVRWEVDWEHPVLDPRGGIEEGDHLMSVWPYREYYLGIPDVWPKSRSLDDELTVSRDGYHFARVQNGQKLIPRGVPGEWDSQFVSKTNTLVIRDDQIWIYFAGTDRPTLLGHPSDSYVFDGHPRGQTGLARVPVDGWTYLRTRPERAEGFATSVPIDMKGVKNLDLSVKADHLRAGKDYLLAELIDADGRRVIEGFGANDCVPVETDGNAIRVSWGKKRLSDAGVRRILIRFYIKGDGVRFYNFGFLG